MLRDIRSPEDAKKIVAGHFGAISYGRCPDKCSLHEISCFLPRVVERIKGLPGVNLSGLEEPTFDDLAKAVYNAYCVHKEQKNPEN